MKQNKILGVFALALSLAVVACGGGTKTSGSTKCSHTYGQETVIKAATCTDPGEGQKVCSKCGDVKKTTIKALGHDYVNDAGAVEADCLHDGHADQTCSRCGDHKTGVTLPATGHKFDGALETDVEAQIGVAGSGHRVCQNANCPGDYEDEAAKAAEDQTKFHSPAWKIEEIPALVPSVTYSKAALTKDNAGDVYLELEGSEQYYDQIPEQFKWALGLRENDPPRNQWGGQGSNNDRRFIYGKAEPAEADYTVLGTINEDKTFKVSFKLTDLVPNAGLVFKGLLNIFVGPYLAENANYGNLSIQVANADGTNTSDKNYVTYYWRNDQGSSSVLSVGVIPSTAPFKLETAVATYVAAADSADEKEHTYVEIGGEWKGDETTVEAVQAALDAVYKVTEVEGKAPVEGVHWTQAEIDAAQDGDPAYGKTVDDWKTEPQAGVEPVVRPVFIQFQSSGNSYYGPKNHSGSSARDPEETPITYELYAKQVGDKICAYVKIDISFMGGVDATVFNTHMNLLDKSQENCVMDKFTNAAVALPGGSKEVVIFDNPDGGNNADNAYGNLAFKVQAKSAA